MIVGRMSRAAARVGPIAYARDVLRYHEAAEP
jgi:hypothetical protein